MAEVHFQAKIRVQKSHITVWASEAQKLGGIPPYMETYVKISSVSNPLIYILLNWSHWERINIKLFRTMFFVHVSMGHLFGVVCLGTVPLLYFWKPKKWEVPPKVGQLADLLLRDFSSPWIVLLCIHNCIPHFMSWLGTTAVWTLQLLIVKLLTLNYAKRDASQVMLSKSVENHFPTGIF